MGSFIVTVLIVLAVMTAVVIAGAPYVERALMYHPNGERVPPAKEGLEGVEDLTLETPDGERLVAWYSPARAGQPTLLYFHGNGGTLGARADRLAGYREMGRGFLIMSYRGYSGSTGSPSEARNVADAKLAYDTLRGFGVAADDIILYGESLGSGVAVQVAAEKPAAGIVLDAPYTSILDVAERCYPYLPSRMLMRDRYDTMKYLPRVTIPMLVIHGEQDEVIPVAMGREVAAKAPGPSEIATFAGAGHSDHYNYGSFEAVNAWIDRLRSSRPQAAQSGLRSAM